MRMKFRIEFKKTTIPELKKKYQNISKNVDKLEEIIINDLKEIGLREIQDSLNGSNFEANEPISIIDEERSIGIKGTQALYDEYGTGTIGGLNSHPEKKSAPLELNAYNSGETIRMNERKHPIDKNDGTGGQIPPNTLYWTYKFEGKKIYTQGRPAGMHIYKAKTKIKGNMDKIIKKRVGEYLLKH